MFHLAVLACAATVLAIPPEDFGFPSAPNDTALTVTYNNNGNRTTVTEGALFGIDVPAQVPTISANTASYRSLAEYNGSYIVLMVDADANYPQNPTNRFVLHWLQPNMSSANFSPSMSGSGRVLTNTSAPFVPYRRPGPPPASDAHRYILYAFHQPSDFAIPGTFAGFSSMNRSRFDLAEFVSAARLGQPAAANYYFCTNKTNVPGTFIAQPGGSYPGGNGAAITAGPGPAPNAAPSGSSSAPAASSTAATNVAAGGVPSAGAISSGAIAAGMAMLFSWAL